MKKTQGKCGECGLTTFEHIGLVPLELVSGEINNAWLRAKVCTRCGTIHNEETTESDIERADKRYLDVLEENDLLTEEERRQL